MRLHFFGVALILAESVKFVEGYRSKNVKEIFKLKKTRLLANDNIFLGHL